MRALRRPDVRVPTLSAGGKGALTAAEYAQAKPDEELKFPDHWNEPDVRGALYAMQGWVCAYCNCKLLHGDRGDVEHFRPKSAGKGDGHSGYFWLAYDFKNYFLACGVCNSSCKGTKFPLETGATHIDYSHRQLLDTERRLLAHPELDPVADWFCVDCIGDLFDIKPKPGLAGLALKRTEETIALFQFNVRRDLVQERCRAIAEATKSHREGQLLEIRKKASRYYAHGMTYREYMRTYLPKLALPSPEEELAWFLEDIEKGRLEIDGILLKEGRDNPREQRLMKEIQWLLAVLWKDPPAGSPAEIQAWLEQRNLLKWVREAYERLG